MTPSTNPRDVIVTALALAFVALNTSSFEKQADYVIDFLAARGFIVVWTGSAQPREPK
jgi:hypothetical protein